MVGSTRLRKNVGRTRVPQPNQVGEAPTRPEKVEATMTAPSLTFRASEGSGRGAGPPTTSAPLRGSKSEPWQEQTNALRSFDHMFTGQP